MKAIRSASYNLFVLSLLLFVGSLTASAQSESTSVALTQQLDSIESRLVESESREKQILENQAKILDELHKLRFLVRRS
ncbi:MAG TPA: hypothetical protein PLY88_03755 [Candidatus Omnitrophota bacterium]|mgnify:CR=1 FL=1|nr:hypothetical protein [Candidatus Omnitrophota bacterium]